MNQEKIQEFNAKFDAAFAADRQDFVRWWSKHPHCDQDNPKYAVRPRVAYKCQIYQDEYMEAKQHGIIETN